MAASLLTVKNTSLLPSQSIFNEIQSIHDTGFFHEIESISKECGLNLVSECASIAIGHCCRQLSKDLVITIYGIGANNISCLVWLALLLAPYTHCSA